MAQATDIVTLAEARTAINLGSSTSHDDELGQWISAVSERIDDLCGPVVQRTIQDETHDGGTPAVVFDELYGASAESVLEYQHTTETELTEETNASKPADAYLLDQVGAGVTYLRRRTAGTDSRFPSGRRNVVVTYTAGRYETTDAVAAKFKIAVGAILRRLWQRDQGAWSTGSDPFDAQASVGFFKAIDPMVHEFLEDELRPPAVA